MPLIWDKHIWNVAGFRIDRTTQTQPKKTGVMACERMKICLSIMGIFTNISIVIKRQKHDIFYHLNISLSENRQTTTYF